jgi:hypothetical protein
MGSSVLLGQYESSPRDVKISKYKMSYWKKNCRFFFLLQLKSKRMIHFYVNIISNTSLLSSIDLIDYLFLLMATNSYDQGISLNHVSDHT